MKHKNSFERGVYEMKRQCSDKGKELLYYIRANLHGGIFRLNAGSSVMKYLWAFFVGAIMSIVVYNVFAHFVPARYLGSLVRIMVLISFGFFGIITIAVYEIVYVNIKKKKFLKSEELYINGATIINVDLENKRILYVEDDVVDGNGDLILFSYPSDDIESKGYLAWERVMIVYNNEGNYHMMKSDDRLNQILGIDTIPLVSVDELMRKAPIPHRNVFQIEKDERALSFLEKEKLAKSYAKLTAQGDVILVSLLGLVLIAGTMFWAVIYGREEGVLQKAINVGVIICIGICLAVYLSYWIMIFYRRKKVHFTHIKEAVADSIESVSSSEFMATVYEWDVNKLEIKKYEKMKCAFSAKYGGVLYRLRTSENEYIFLPKDEVKM